MAEDSAKFVGDIPGIYDRALGPHIFEDYAAETAKRASDLKPQSVLELAAGTGIVSRKLRDALPKATQLIVTDLNEPMLGIAKRKFGAGESVMIRMADAQALPFKDGEFDLIVCQFGVMFFPDKIGSFREARRVLKKGGHYLFNVWGPLAHNPFGAIASEVTASFFADNPPGFYRVPFGYHDVNAVSADLRQAGFSEIRHETKKVDKTVSDFALFAHGLVHGNPMIAEINARATAKPEAVEAKVIETLRRELGKEPASMPLEAIFFTARSP